MARFQHPPRGEKEFPRSRGWSGKSWAGVIDHHIAFHGSGDYFIGFDDEDRLCVTCTGEKGYATRIPLPLVDWTEREIAAAGVEAKPNSPYQFRLARGEGGSRLSDAPLPDPESLKLQAAERAGIDPDRLRYFAGASTLNLQIDGEGPVFMRETAMDRFAIAWMSRVDDRWELWTGILDPQEPEPLRMVRAVGDVRQVRPGGVLARMEEFLASKVERDAEMRAKLDALTFPAPEIGVPGAGDFVLDEDDGPQGP